MKISVIGSGTMGRGIGQIFAQKGFNVTQVDVSEDILKIAKDSTLDSLRRLEKKGLIEESIEKILKRIDYTNEISSINDSDFIIEAVFERLDIKNQTLAQISNYAKESAIIGTNTSSISINLLSKNIKNPERFLGIHFFNPVPIMKLVEIVSGERTSKEVVEKATTTLITLGKDPVFSKDFPGFISNRVLMPLIKEAILVYEEGIASPSDVDKTFRLGMSHPMGPLELADFIGLDVCYDIMEVLYINYGDPRFKPPVTLRNLINSGKLGRKSGEGFYKHEVKK
jgi:3-hydroxybutyryl-CoA dehydrogenase